MPDLELSIIIPLYNVEPWIRDCIDSALQISELNYEIIIIDDGSTDSSYLIAEEYQKNYPNLINLIKIENSGVSIARNIGLDNAKGDAILFIDSDDVIEPVLINDLVLLLKKDSLDVVIANGYSFLDKESPYSKSRKKLYTKTESLVHKETISGIEYLNNFFKSKNNNLVVWDKIYSREFLSNNDIRFLPGIIHEDVPFIFNVLSKSKKVKYIDSPFYLYRIRSGSIMDSLTIKSANSRIFIVNYLINKLSIINMNLSSINNYLVYQLYRASEHKVTIDRKNIMKLLLGRLSFKKRLQCIHLLILSFKNTQ